MGQLIAVQGNREVKIAETEKKAYNAKGYDIFEVEEGQKPKRILKAGGTDEKLKEALAEISALKKRIAELEKDGSK